MQAMRAGVGCREDEDAGLRKDALLGLSHERRKATRRILDGSRGWKSRDPATDPSVNAVHISS